MVASQFSIYNQALILCEERILANPTEARKPRYLLDTIWNDGGVNACLEEGIWSFAIRTLSVVADPNVKPPFGYINAFQKPTDYVRTTGVSSDPYFQSSFTQYQDEKGWWWADINQLYAKIISNDPSYGMNLDGWPESFKIFVEYHFASKIVKALTHNKEIQDRVEAGRKKALDSARGKDGMNEPAQFFQRGQLSRARQGMYFGRGWAGGGYGNQ